MAVKPVYSPDGTHVEFVCFEVDDLVNEPGIADDGIYVMDADGTNVTPLVDDAGVSENHPAWGVAAR